MFDTIVTVPSILPAVTFDSVMFHKQQLGQKLPYALRYEGHSIPFVTESYKILPRKVE